MSICWALRSLVLSAAPSSSLRGGARHEKGRAPAWYASVAPGTTPGLGATWSLPETATRVTPKRSNPWQTWRCGSRTPQSRAGAGPVADTPRLARHHCPDRDRTRQQLSSIRCVPGKKDPTERHGARGQAKCNRRLCGRGIGPALLGSHR